MKSAARFMGHPIHPMLIPYPFAFLSSTVVFDIVAARRRDPDLARTATHLRNAGIATALGAAIPGIIDYFGAVPSGRPKETATRHALSNVSALTCFAAAAALANSRANGHDRPHAGVIALELAGTALLSIGGWLGGSLSYHHQVGVDPEEHPQLAASSTALEAPRSTARVSGGRVPVGDAIP